MNEIEQPVANQLRNIAATFGQMEHATFKGWKVRDTLLEMAEALTNSKHGLPTAPGRYEDDGQDSGWMLHGDGTWHYNGGPSVQLLTVAEHGPFTRLIPKRPQVTRKQIDAAAKSANAEHELNARPLSQWVDSFANALKEFHNA